MAWSMLAAAMSRPVVVLSKDLSDSIRAGHPWIFDRALRAMPSAVRAGDEVEIEGQGRRLAVGFADPGSPIAVRILEPDAGAEVGAAWARQRAREAAGLRVGDPRLGASDGVRVIHGEGDYLPGLVIDVYAGHAVVVFDGAGAAAFWSARLDSVLAGIEDSGMVLHSATARVRSRGPRVSEVVHGVAPPETVVIEENGARFEVDLAKGQKTGFFLDQRDNRALIGGLAAGADVLNLFAYTGGFSVHAALGGARRVTTVDVAAPAVRGAERNFELNGLDRGAHVFVAADAFEVLAREQDAGRRYDLVICDPPSFAPSQRARGNAVRAYLELNVAALAVVAPGGLLVTASCSSHYAEADLIACVAEASARAGRRTRLHDVRGAATDHPVRPAFPEGRYLSLLIASVT